jgi:hypothetical protein
VKRIVNEHPHEDQRVRAHFILLAAVICPNIALLSKTAVYAASVSSELSVAVPKYFHPMAFAAEFSLVVDVPEGRVAAAVVVANAAALIPATRKARRTKLLKIEGIR